MPWLDEEDMCPCLERRLEEKGESSPELWQTIYMSFVLLYMLVALLSDRVGSDSVMLVALTLSMAAGIITIDEGLEGFSNEGVLSVMALFMVAQGISVTGALDWYMGKLLGNPTTEAGAQLRLMVPIAIVSAFLNNTPVVVVMIPIVQRWAKNIGISHQQLLIPLSFATILGGACTLIGTSTNLVVVGLVKDRYPGENISNIGLFDVGQYGVPVAIAGIAYILLTSPFLLPGGKTRKSGEHSSLMDNAEDEILLGARLTQWSPAAGRSVKRSGLRDTGGIYLVSVHRAATGNVHRAVGQDFVLNVGDILYFTGLVEEFGDFCEEHGLEVVTNEIEETLYGHAVVEEREEVVHFKSEAEMITNEEVSKLMEIDTTSPVAEHECQDMLDGVPCKVGLTKESLLHTDEAEKLRTINRMADVIRGITSNESSEGLPTSPGVRSPVVTTKATDPPQIVVTTDFHEFGSQPLALVGVNARDRPGLLLDISKGLLRLELQLRHTEAAVVNERSISVWRCEFLGTRLPDVEEIWSVLNALLEAESGVAAIKMRGLKVIRAVVTKGSRLVGRTAAEVDFRETYKSAIVAVQQGGKNTSQALSSVKFNVGDVLVLQASDESPLLVRPPGNFYEKDKRDSGDSNNRQSRRSSLANLVTHRFGSNNFAGVNDSDGSAHENAVAPEDAMDAGFFVGDDSEPPSDSSGGIDPEEQMANLADRDKEETENVWRDLRVIFANKDDSSSDVAREFLTAMEVAPNSQLAKKTAAQAGISKLPGVFLITIERPLSNPSEDNKPRLLTVCEASSATGSIETFGNLEPTFVTIDPDEPLASGDVLWFAGSASAVGDLRKIPGLKSAENEEVEKINEKVHDRRLVQAVIARKGPLVGKTVKEVKFRTRYGAAVIAVRREGKRIHDHPGNIKLQAGDVLLLEAGPTFIEMNKDNDRAFALLAEVDNSAPPRLRFLIPALVIVAAMLILVTGKVASLIVCALVAAIIMVVLGIMSEQEARNAVNWEVYVTIACAFGISTALANSGVAGGVANFLVRIGTAVGIGDAGLLGSVYLATFLISNVVTNNAAAALIFPIAMNAAEQTGTDRIIMCYCVMLSASASFMTPYGYTTNILIYGPGGYTFKDYVLIGTPMQIVLWILSVAILAPSSFPWYLSWIITSVVLIVVAALRMTNCINAVKKIYSKMLCRGSAETKVSSTGSLQRIETESS